LVLGARFYSDFAATKDFADFPFLYKVFYYYIAIFSMRMFYYAGWCITDGGIIASGLGYGGKNKEGKDVFDHIYSIKILSVELELSPQIMIQHWNHQIHLWLKYYIYNRTLVKGKKPGLINNLATFVTSAFWHGFYPFYYVMFFFCALLGELSKDIYRSRIFFRWIPYPLNSILAK
jgi:lysophospholipid acyltransferase